MYPIRNWSTLGRIYVIQVSLYHIMFKHILHKWTIGKLWRERKNLNNGVYNIAYVRWSYFSQMKQQLITYFNHPRDCRSCCAFHLNYRVASSLHKNIKLSRQEKCRKEIILMLDSGFRKFWMYLLPFIKLFLMLTFCLDKNNIRTAYKKKCLEKARVMKKKCL